MSIVKTAFGIGFTAGMFTAAILGAPLLPAIGWGLLTGAFTAAIAAAPPVHARVAVIPRPTIFTRAYWGSPWHVHGPRVVHAHRPVGGVRVLPTATAPRAPASGSFMGGWFPSRPAAGGSTTVHHPAGASRPVAATTASAGFGTRHSFASAVPSHAAHVTHTRTFTKPGR